MLSGGIAGAAVTLVVLIYKDSHRPETGVANNFTSINGTGSTFIGRSEVATDGSYLTTEWFSIGWVPVFPVCTYRLIKIQEKSNWVVQTYIIKEKHPVKGRDLGMGYLRTAIVVTAAATILWCTLGR